MNSAFPRTFRHLALSILAGALLSLTASAQWQSIGPVTHFEKTSHGVIFTAGQAQVDVSVISEDVFRIRMSPSGEFQPDSSWAVITGALGDPSFTVRENDSCLIISGKTGNSVKVSKHPLRISFVDASGAIINEDSPKGMAWSGNQISVWKSMPENERYYGFGEKAGQVERRNKMMTNWNSDIPAYAADTDPLYQTIPFFYGIRTTGAYGIFFDNTFQSYFDMGKESLTEYSFGAAGGELNYYFFFGPTPKHIIGNFSALTGKMPLPPLWSLGFQQSRWSYPKDARVREIATNFRSKQIPCDVIYLDIDYMDGYRCFTWSDERFPDPKKLVSDLGKDGFKLAVIIDPGIKQDSSYSVFRSGLSGKYFSMKPDGTPFYGKVWPGVCAFPDFSSSATRTWWGSQYKNLVETGIKGFWNDMNEPSVFDVPTKTFDLDVRHDNRGMGADHRSMHNIYGMQMARGTYEGVLKLNPDERPFVLTRANYAGGQRYTAAWTGDNVSSWEHLKMALGMSLNVSISGQPFIGSDIGGFIGNPDGELFARWLELGVFTPFMRAHSEISSKNKEPWEYGKEFEDVNRNVIGMRYQFLPYIYSAFRDASVTGVPMMRPTVFDYYGDQWTYGNDEQFLFGDALLVAPVVRQGSTRKHVRLPAGNWYNYWTDETFTGPKDLDVEAPIGFLPLFAKGGTIVPTQPVVQYTGASKGQPLTVNIFPTGPKGDVTAFGILYDDDGISFGFKRGVASVRTVSLTSDGEKTNLVVSKNSGTYHVPVKLLTLQIHNQQGVPSKVTIDNRTADKGTGERPNSWMYDGQKHLLSVVVNDTDAGHEVTIQ